ncbi:SDR family NAD(P)-dependent oxidoreductase, partial [bacterium]|nr:SDR family NAD(P)-dependent oxidoreductase [bacterium]
MTQVKRRVRHLVGISSLAAYRGLPKSATYCATKAFVTTFLESFRLDLKPRGIAVTVVHPGFVDTPIHGPKTPKLPFMISAEKCADEIWKGIRAKKAIVDFPFPLAALTKIGRFLPSFLF